MPRGHVLAVGALVVMLLLPAGSSALAHSMTITGPTPSSFSPEDGQTTTIRFMPTDSGYYTVNVVSRFHDLGWFPYINVYGKADGVTYYENHVREIFKNSYVTANTTKTVTWGGTATNGKYIQQGLYYFEIIPDADVGSKRIVAVAVNRGTGIEPWRAYIRQARTWNCTYARSGVSREGVDCTGFVITAFREMGYTTPYPQCDTYGIYSLWSSTYVTQTSYANLKQGDLFAWNNAAGGGPWNHTALYTYSSGTTKYFIESYSPTGVVERPIPSSYLSYDPNPHMFYWTAVGHGPSA